MTPLRNYIITEQIGSGATATVSKAIQKSLDRFVALKQIHPHLSDDPRYALRLEREAKAAASLEHINIMDVIDFGREGEQYFIVAEYIDGPSLYQVIDAAKILPVDVAVCISTQILKGLEHAHNKGVIHRDIKPDNILFTGEGVVKITDFGIAKADSMPSLTRRDQRVMGTPSYMSPEQAEGKKADRRSDLFSTGVILYQMLTGKLPFSAESTVQTLKKLIEKSHEPISSLNPEIPEELSHIVDHALEKEMTNRFFDATEFYYALTKFAGSNNILLGSEVIPGFLEKLFPVRRRARGIGTATASRIRGLHPTTGIGGKRPTAAILPLTGCFGCQVNILDLHEKIDTFRDMVDVRFSYLMDEKTIPEVDIGIVEGCVANSENAERLETLRKSCTTLVALGTCACFGGIPGLRNLFPVEQVLERAYEKNETTAPYSMVPDDPETPELLELVKCVSGFVKTDFMIPGCPSPHHLIIDLFEHLTKGKPLDISTHALCFECGRTRREMVDGKMEFISGEIHSIMELPEIDPEICFLEQGVLCMGLTTRSGCFGRCLKNNIPCQGCMGPVPQIKETGAKWINTLGTLLPGGSIRYRHDLVGVGYGYTMASSMMPGGVKHGK